MKKLLYIILLLPLWVNAQTNGTIQKTSATGTIRGSFGSLGIDTLPRVTGALVDGYILKYHAATNKWYASPDIASGLSTTTISNGGNTNGISVASGVFRLHKVTATTGGVLTTGMDTIAGDKSWTGTQTIANNVDVTYGTTGLAAIQATSTNAGGRALAALANSTLEPFAVTQQGSGQLAAFNNGATGYVLFRNNGSIYTRGQLEVGNLSVGDATDSVMVHRALDLTVRRVPTTGTGNAVFSSGAIFTDSLTIPDEAFGVAWNGKLQPTTKNAMWDVLNGSFVPYTGSSTGLDLGANSLTLTGPLSSGVGSFTSNTGTDPLTINTTTGDYGFISHKYGGVIKGVTGYNAGNMYYGGESGNGTILQSNGATAVTVSTSQLLRFHAYGAGTLTTDASGNVTATSDSTWKENFKPFTRGLAELKTLKPVRYHWNQKSGLDRDNEYVYFKAQDVQKSIPEAVFPPKEGQPLGVQDRPIIATMINAINELHSKIQVLEARILILESNP